MKFNEKLISLRKKEGLSQEELGYKLNVTRQTVSKWELGQTTPEMDKLSEMSKIFNISVDQLINDSEIDSDSNVDPINSKIEDQPIQEGGENNKMIYIVVMAIIVLILVIAGASIKYISDKKEEKAAGEILNMATGIINNAANSVQNNNSNTVGEFFNASTGIINSTVNSMQNGSSKDDMANSMAEGFNMISGIIGGNTDSNLSNQISQTQNEVSVKSFNGHIELYAGTSKSLHVVAALDNIITSNKKNDRKITVKYDKTETQDEAKIRSIKQTINKASAFQDFEVICEYDAQGYIYKVIIEKI